MADLTEAVDALTRQMSEVQIMGQARRSKDVAMPSVNNSYRFDALGTKLANCTRNSYGERNREFIAFFGCPPIVMAKVWELMREHGTLTEKAKDRHLLWALHYLKEYPSLRVMCSTMRMRDETSKPDDKTLYKWIWIVIEAIADLEKWVILWDNRLKNDRGNDCLIGVDCKDCRFQQILVPDPKADGKMKVNKALYSPKIRGPALRYEVATSLLSDDIVWISGPYLPGDWNDLEIFRDRLKHMLHDAGERAEADGGYLGEAPDYIVCPQSLEIAGDDLKLQMNKRAQGRIEVVNKHLVHWKCLGGTKFVAKGTGMEKMEKHRLMFTACVVLKQIGMDLGFGELYKMGKDYY